MRYVKTKNLRRLAREVAASSNVAVLGVAVVVAHADGSVNVEVACPSAEVSPLVLTALTDALASHAGEACLIPAKPDDVHPLH